MKANETYLTFRERCSMLVLITLTQMMLRVLNFADFRIELENDMKELKNLIKSYDLNPPKQ